MEPLVYILIGVALALAGVLARTHLLGFVAQRPGDYADLGPEFDLRRQLNGPIACEGVIYGPTGRVTSRFTAEIETTWDGNSGMMTESFHYDSGATQERYWKLTLGNDGAIRAEAPDVIGLGRGMQVGPGVQMKYRIRLPEESGGHVLDATDWMYLVEDGKIINRSQFRKFGIKVAELVATMRRVEPA